MSEDQGSLEPDTLLAPGIWQIDTWLGGWPEANAVFLIEAEQPCLVETGPQRDAEKVLAALQRHGLGPADLAWIVVSHVHLDHAGAVGEVASQFPGATVVSHRRGVRHLADPTRLVAAAGRVYGDRLDSLYGRMTPVDQDRLQAAEDGRSIDLGRGRRLRVIDAPGHAKHHIGVLEEESGVLMAGDAVGVKLPGRERLRPATPPDDFDLEQALQSLHRFAELHPQKLVLTHYGSVGAPDEVLAEAEERLLAWSSLARDAYHQSPTLEHVEEALRRRFAPAQPVEDPNSALDLLTGIRSNSAGLFGWLQRSESSEPSPG